MSTTDINKDIDLCLLKHIKKGDSGSSDSSNDFNVDEVATLLYEEYKNNKNRVYPLEVFHKRLADIKKYQAELKELLKLPLMKQRTEEWFEARKSRLTASDLYDAVKGGNVSIKLAKKKANIIIDNINYNAIPALKWGTMFEPMATRCYSQKMNNIDIHDFGLICDAENKHFGASPDGINELGIMLEIKCPYSRKIVDGVIPDKYRMQIQGQLAVCKLKECDYIECIFKSIEDKEEYLEIDHNTTKHGVIAEYYNSKGEYVYYYSDADRTPKECVEDICDYNNNFKENLKFSKYTFWKLDEMIIQRVVFNAIAWETIVPKIDAFWEKVEEYKMLPIEIGIKKYKFVDDDDADDAADAANANTADTKANTTSSSRK
jgi:putative phage-type endonuclease